MIGHILQEESVLLQYPAVGAAASPSSAVLLLGSYMILNYKYVDNLEKSCFEGTLLFL